MPFNFKYSAKTDCFFIVPSTFNNDSLTENEKNEVVRDLLANSNLVATNFSKYVGKEHAQELAFHINANRTRILSYFEIRALYHDVSDNALCDTTDFKFDSPSFLRAKSVVFDIFAKSSEATQSEKDNFIQYILFEIAKCKHLTSCDFIYYDTNKKIEPFLAQRQEAVLKYILAQHKKYQRKFQFDATMFWAVTFGLVGLMTIGLPGFGLLKGLACSAFLFVGGVNFGSIVSYIRKHALYAAGANALQDLKEDKVPDSDDLKEAMALGFKSRQWSPYLNSFLHVKSYQPDNYRAYAAGLYAGTQRLKEESSTIKRKLSL